MTQPVEDAVPNVESRLAALEAAVARLTTLVEPGFAVANIAAPVAMPWLKEAAQHEFSAKFFALLDIGEALLKYSAAIAFAALVQAGDSQKSEIVELFKLPPTLGKIAEGLRKALDISAISDWPMNTVREAFRKPNKKQTPVSRYLMDEFINIRNDQRGHGAQQPEGHYESLYLKNYLIIQDCVRECKYLQYPLLHVHAVDHLKEQYAYKVTLLMGGAPTSVPEAIITATKLKVGSICIWDRGSRFLPLLDFLSYRYCATCGLEHVFLAERITDEKVSFHSYTGNHRIDVERKEE